MNELKRVVVLTGIFVIANLSAFAQERMIGGGPGITVFADRNFRGSAATYSRDMPNLNGTNFDNRISSIRVGPGESWEVCENANYRGNCVVVSGEESDLGKNNWDNKISSFRRAGGSTPGPSPQNPYIVLYTQYNYRGTASNYDGPVNSLEGRAMSVTVGRGRWELCQGSNFSGKCVTVTRSIPDLRSIGMNGRVASARPLDPSQPDTPGTDDWYLVLYSSSNYRGNPTNYNGPQTRINRTVGSVTIGKGVWELCTEANYSGRCETLTSSRSTFRRNVRSLRPVLRQPR